MKYFNKIILISLVSIFCFSIFTPVTKTQRWTYNGADTERIANFSVYPSEWYVINSSDFASANVFEIVEGNISDTFEEKAFFSPYYGTLENGTCIFANLYTMDLPSGILHFQQGNVDAFYWNETIGYLALSPVIIPINEITGKVTPEILNEVSRFVGIAHLTYPPHYTYEYNATFPDIYSIRYWNETYNDAYIYLNYTENGIFTRGVNYKDGVYSNTTLYSKPAQLPPEFNLNTVTGFLRVESTKFKLSIWINAADNNNDRKDDQDYLYRALNGSTWSDWASPMDQVDWDLGDVPAGEYNITVEVKNMYGVTQKQITVIYGPEVTNIPSYSILLLFIFIVFSISIISHRYFKKLRF